MSLTSAARTCARGTRSWVIRASSPSSSIATNVLLGCMRAARASVTTPVPDPTSTITCGAPGVTRSAWERASQRLAGVTADTWRTFPRNLARNRLRSLVDVMRSLPLTRRRWLVGPRCPRRDPHCIVTPAPGRCNRTRDLPHSRAIRVKWRQLATAAMGPCESPIREGKPKASGEPASAKRNADGSPGEPSALRQIAATP